MLLFPQRLHKVLDEGKYESIISWQFHGRAFKVHKREEFVKTVLPLFAKSGRTYASFMRQLNYYGYKRNDLSGPDKGSYYHPHFLRGRFDLCKDYMSRKQNVLDNKGPKNPDNIAPSLDPKKAAKGEVGNVLISPLPTAANPVPISKPFHEAEVYRSQWNSTHGKYPKSLDPADQHGVSRHLYPSDHYPQLQSYERKLSMHFLQRECRNDFHPNQYSQECSYLYQYPNLYSYHSSTYESNEGFTTTHISSNLQPSYQQDHYKEQRQDYEEGQVKRRQSEVHMISAQSQNHRTMMGVPPPLENKNEKKDIIPEHTQQHRYIAKNSFISQREFSNPARFPQFDDVSEGDSIQHDSREERNFTDHFHTIDNSLETIQQQDNDFCSSYTPRASGSGARQFWNSSSRQVSYDAVNDIAAIKESELHASIEPVPDKDILQAFYNADSLKGSTSEDSLQMSFSFLP